MLLENKLPNFSIPKEQQNMIKIFNLSSYLEKIFDIRFILCYRKQ